MHADLQRLLSDRLLDDLQSKPIERLRQIRHDATQAEGDVSFVRRVAQGRIDIVGHERNRRSGAADGESAADLLYAIPDILSDEPSPAGAATGGPGRNVPVLEPGKLASELGNQLDAIVSPAGLSSVDELSAAELSDLFEQLREFEVGLSSARRGLHDQIDALQDEIARRYRDGELSVDALLDPDSRS